MVERFTEDKPGHFLTTCEICYVRDTENIIHARDALIKMWTDHDTGLTVCDECKKCEGKRS